MSGEGGLVFVIKPSQFTHILLCARRSDPGYKDTARMLVEAGLSLALPSERPLKNAEGGVYTPAACQGEVLLDRLLATGTDFRYDV